MAFSRVAAMRSFARAVRPTVVRPQLYRQVARRTYASGGHESAQSGGDAIWAAAATIITIPSCWYILQSTPDTSHGHGDHGDSHGQKHDEEHEDEPQEESKDEATEDKSEDKSEGKAEESEDQAEDKADKKSDKESAKSKDSDSDDEEQGADTPDTSDDEDESQKDSGLDDKASASKPAGDTTTQSGKQEGLSNTDTKHSTDITNNPDKSQKAEGDPESAKSKGSVDPKRPQA